MFFQTIHLGRQFVGAVVTRARAVLRKPLATHVKARLGAVSP